MFDLNFMPLIGIVVVVVGFALKFNPLLVVSAAGIATGIAVDMNFIALIETFGEKFMNSRQLASFLLILPVIAILERYGLQQRAKTWVANIKGATTTRILSMYFIVRECSAALGLLSLAGQAQTVRPLLAPMALGAASNTHGDLPKPIKDLISAHAAACDNIAVFFGEDIFIAFGAVLLMDAFLKENGIAGIEPLHIGLWAIPTAIAALIVHLFRLARFEAKIRNLIANHKSQQTENAEGALS